MVPADFLNETLSRLNIAREAIGISDAVIALFIPLVIWLIRKPVASMTLKVFKAIAKALGITIGSDLETGIPSSTVRDASY